MSVSAVIVAAGSGERLGQDRPKALVEVGGEPMVRHAALRLLAGGADELVVVHPARLSLEFARVLDDLVGVTLVVGGATRTGSVRAGVAASDADAELIAIHDAARPFIPSKCVRMAIASVAGQAIAAAPALPVADTLKRPTPEGRIRTVDRADLWAVQTPQVVRADVYRAVLDWAPGEHTTDDLGLVESAIDAGVVEGKIVLVPGDPRALKITYPRDLMMAEAVLAAERARRG